MTNHTDTWNDPRLAYMKVTTMPFDPKRKFFGGFTPLVEM